jgi:enoyl-[acyl-carrier protein] reductase I
VLDVPELESAEWIRSRFAESGKKLDLGKSCIRFRKLDGLPLEVVAEAASRITVAQFIAHSERGRAEAKTRKPKERPRYNSGFMSQLLAGKTALILGVANRWSIAWAIAQAFHREGAKLILTYQGERQQKTVEELAAEVGHAALLPCDVSKDDEIAAMASKLEAPIDALVHSIAFANREDLSRPFAETSRAGFALAQDISAYSLVAVTRAVAPLMTNGGSVMTLTYLGSQRVIQNYNVMGVAKASLEAASRYLAADLGPKGIRVNSISAGPIKTTSARGVKDFSSILDVVAQRAPLRRNCEPAEVADTAVFLASDLGRGVTGNVLYVDAGFQIIGF